MKDRAVADFYDKFVDTQAQIKVNERIYGLFKRMKNLGLNKKSRVLELGSGIGTMTALISRIASSGSVETVELSPESVKYAKSRLNRPNVVINQGDVVTYEPKGESFDFVTLFDVIEHIPKEKHVELFSNISSHMNSGTKLIINIPNPDCIEYDQVNQPEVLQIIDQPIHIHFLLPIFEKIGLTVRFMEKYGVWVKDDYVFYVIEKRKKFEEKKIQEQRTFSQKVRNKLLRLKLKYFYR